MVLQHRSEFVPTLPSRRRQLNNYLLALSGLSYGVPRSPVETKKKGAETPEHPASSLAQEESAGSRFLRQHGRPY